MRSLGALLSCFILLALVSKLGGSNLNLNLNHPCPGKQTGKIGGSNQNSKFENHSDISTGSWLQYLQYLSCMIYMETIIHDTHASLVVRMLQHLLLLLRFIVIFSVTNLFNHLKANISQSTIKPRCLGRREAHQLRRQAHQQKRRPQQ